MGRLHGRRVTETGADATRRDHDVGVIIDDLDRIIGSVGLRLLAPRMTERLWVTTDPKLSDMQGG